MGMCSRFFLPNSAYEGDETIGFRDTSCIEQPASYPGILFDTRAWLETPLGMFCNIVESTRAPVDTQLLSWFLFARRRSRTLQVPDHGIATRSDSLSNIVSRHISSCRHQTLKSLAMLWYLDNRNPNWKTSGIKDEDIEEVNFCPNSGPEALKEQTRCVRRAKHLDLRTQSLLG